MDKKYDFSDFENVSPETSSEYDFSDFEESYTPTTPEKKITKLQSFGRGARQGATFGFADEISAKTQQLLDKILGVSEANRKLAEQGFTGDIGPTDSSQVYEQARQEELLADKAASDANKWSYLGGEIVGGIAAPVPAVAGAKLLSSGAKALSTSKKGTKLAEGAAKVSSGADEFANIISGKNLIDPSGKITRNLGKLSVEGAKTGAAAGALMGLGTTKDITDVSEVAKDVGYGTGLGGLGGAILSPALTKAMTPFQTGAEIVDYFGKGAYSKAKAATERGIELKNIEGLSEDAVKAAGKVRETLEGTFELPNQSELNALKQEMTELNTQIKQIRNNKAEQSLLGKQEIQAISSKIRQVEQEKSLIDSRLSELKKLSKSKVDELTTQEKANIDSEITALEKERDDFISLLNEAKEENKAIQSSYKETAKQAKEVSSAEKKKIESSIKETETNLLNSQKAANDVTLAKSQQDLNAVLKDIQVGVVKADSNIENTFTKLYSQADEVVGGSLETKSSIDAANSMLNEGALAAAAPEIKDPIIKIFEDYTKKGPLNFREYKQFLNTIYELSKTSQFGPLRGALRKTYGNLNDNLYETLTKQGHDELATNLKQNNLLFRASSDLKDRFLDNFDLNMSPLVPKAERGSRFVEEGLMRTARQMIKSPESEGSTALFKQTAQFIPETAEVLPRLEEVTGAIRQAESFQPQVPTDNPELTFLKNLLEKTAAKTPEQIEAERGIMATAKESGLIAKEVKQVVNDVKDRIKKISSKDPKQAALSNKEIIEINSQIDKLSADGQTSQKTIQDLRDQLFAKSNELESLRLAEDFRISSLEDTINQKRVEADQLAKKVSTPSREQELAENVFSYVAPKKLEGVKKLSKEMTGERRQVDEYISNVLTDIIDNRQKVGKLEEFKKKFGEIASPEVLEDALQKADDLNISRILNQINQAGPKEFPAISPSQSAELQTQLLARGTLRTVGGAESGAAKLGRFAGRIVKNPEGFAKVLNVGGKLGDALRKIMFEATNAQERSALVFALLQNKAYRDELEKSGVLDEGSDNEEAGR